MPQIDYSVGFTAAEVEEILSIQKAELKKTLAAYANDGSSVSKRRINEIHAIIAACQRALQKLDPTRYPPPIRVAASRVDSRMRL